MGLIYVHGVRLDDEYNYAFRLDLFAHRGDEIDDNKIRNLSLYRGRHLRVKSDIKRITESLK